MKDKYQSNLSRFFEKVNCGSIKIITPEGKELLFSGRDPGPTCDLIIKDWQAIAMAFKTADIGLGKAYQLHMWESSNLADFFTFLTLNFQSNDKEMNPSLIKRLQYSLYNNYVRLNTRAGSKKNIAGHYDISNSFYKLWLDKSMTYSCALVKDENDTLENSQRHKYQRIIDVLQPHGGNVLEIGCGWGGFAEYASNVGANVTGVTISKNQYEFAKARLNQKATILQKDYRDINKKFDHIVSIEMFEHVGEKYWPTYFNKIKESLTKNGKALIQTMTIREDIFKNYKNSGDFIRQNYFQGGLLPSISRFCAHANKAGLHVGTIHEFGKDYAWTLKKWLRLYEDSYDSMKALGLDDSFIRGWKVYLSMCVAAFACRRTGVSQIELTTT